MKYAVAIVAGILLCGLAACGHTSGLQGKIEDGVGKPRAGVTVVASQVKPLKGHARFESLTGPDGAFAFRGLYPCSDYVLSARSKDWTTETSVTLQSAPRGETALLPDGPLKVRFTVNADGIIKDSKSGLEWVAGPDKDTNFREAKAWAGSLAAGGGGWRLPALAELKGLYDEALAGREFKIDPIFHLTVSSVWSGDEINPGNSRGPYPWYVSFYYGNDLNAAEEDSTNLRAFAVRQGENPKKPS